LTVSNWKSAKEFLAGLAGKPRFGLFSDLDGTLSPISATPEAAQITPRNRELLAELRDEIALVAIISGRRADNLQESVGLPGVVYVGNHGLERWEDGGIKIATEAKPYLSAIQAAEKELKTIDGAGIRVEEKGPTLSFHYRQVENRNAFARNIAPRLAEIAEKHKLELFTGKMVFEFRPPVDIDKGIAFEQLVSEYKLVAALFLGDDVSDLSAIRMARKLREQQNCDAWGIGVQSREEPEVLADTADFLADGVADLEGLLSWLLKASKASST
jgi:trehalose 6-phosphate phosphatase